MSASSHEQDNFKRRDWYDYDLEEWVEEEKRVPYPDLATCPECEGSGTVERTEVVRTSYGDRIAPDSPTYRVECGRCQGNGTVDADEGEDALVENG